MQTTKIITALIFGVFGFWAFSLIGGDQARHILITETNAYVLDNGMIAATFSMENTGAPDRITSARNGQSPATLRSPTATGSIVLPTGRSALSLEGAHIVLPAHDEPPAAGTLLPLELSLESGHVVTAFIKVAANETMPSLHGTMMHGAMAFDMGDPPPSLTIDAAQSDNGWLINAETKHFVFDASAVDTDHVVGAGHGHVYVGGTKIGRMLQPSAHIGALPPGQHTIRVTLNTNNHVAYMRDGNEISATTVIQVDE